VNALHAFAKYISSAVKVQTDNLGGSRRWFLMQELIGIQLVYLCIKASDAVQLAWIAVCGVGVAFYFKQYDKQSPDKPKVEVTSEVR
jgi:hypothetical protein